MISDSVTLNKVFFLLHLVPTLLAAADFNFTVCWMAYVRAVYVMSYPHNPKYHTYGNTLHSRQYANDIFRAHRIAALTIIKSPYYIPIIQYALHIAFHFALFFFIFIF